MRAYLVKINGDFQKKGKMISMAAVHYKAPRRKCLVIEVLIIQKGQVARHNQREYYVYRGNNLILNETISNEYVSKKVRAISKNQRDRLPI